MRLWLDALPPAGDSGPPPGRDESVHAPRRSENPRFDRPRLWRAIERRAGLRYVPEDASDVPSTATAAKNCRRSGLEVGADVFRVIDGHAEVRHVPEGCRLVAGAAGGAERAASPQGGRQKFKASLNSRPARADVGHADLGVLEDVAAIGGVSPANK